MSAGPLPKPFLGLASPPQICLCVVEALPDQIICTDHLVLARVRPHCLSGLHRLLKPAMQCCDCHSPYTPQFEDCGKRLSITTTCGDLPLCPPPSVLSLSPHGTILLSACPGVRRQDFRRWAQIAMQGKHFRRQASAVTMLEQGFPADSATMVLQHWSTHSKWQCRSIRVRIGYKRCAWGLETNVPW